MSHSSGGMPDQPVRGRAAPDTNMTMNPWGFAQDCSSKLSTKRVTPLPITFAFFCPDEGNEKMSGQSRNFPGFSYFYYMNSHENNCSDREVRKVSVSAMLYRNVVDQLDYR